MSGSLTVDELVAIIEAADTDEDWQRSVSQYGPVLLSDLSLIYGLARRIVDASERGAVEEAARLERWRSAAQGANAENRLKETLSNVSTPPELDVLIAAHSADITPRLVQSALYEVQQLLSGSAGMPAFMALMSADHILWIALRLAEHLNQPDLIVECLLRRSQVFSMRGEPEASLQVVERAAQVAEAAHLTFELGKCLTIAGDALHEAGRDNEALAKWIASIEPLTETDADALLGPTHEDIAQLYFDRGGEPKALAHWESAAHHRIRAGQLDRALPLLYAVISTYLTRGDPSRALPAVETLRTEVSDSEAIDPDIVELVRGAAVDEIIAAQPELEFYNGSAYGTYVADEQSLLARRWFAAAEALHRLAPTDEGQAILQLAGTFVALQSSDLVVARDRATQARQWFLDHESWPQVSSATIGLVQVAWTSGRLAEAADWAEQACALPGMTAQGQAGLRTVQAQCLLDSGDPRGALTSLQSALELSRTGVDRTAQANEAATWYGFGLAYSYLGDAEAAVKAFANAARITVEIGHRRGEAATMTAFGILLGKARAGRFGQVTEDLVAGLLAAAPGEVGGISLDEAGIAVLERALEVCREINDEPGRISAMLNLSNFLPNDQAERRIELLTEVLERKRALRDQLGEAVTLANIGSARRLLGDRAGSFAAFRDSLAIARDAGYGESAALSARALGRIAAEVGNLAEAKVRYGEAIDQIERVRPNLPERDEYRVGFGQDKGQAYLELVDLLVADGEVDEAYGVVQRAKSRALLELVAGGEIAPTAPLTCGFAELLEQEKTLLAALRVAAAGGPVGAPAAFASLESVYAEMEAADPQYVAIRRGMPASLNDIRIWLDRQIRSILLIDYFITDGRVTVFGLRREWPGPRMRTFPCSPEELQDSYDDFRRQVVSYRNSAGQSWTRLSQILTAPLREWLQEGDLICLVPHRLLHHLPLHALPLDTEPLIADYAIIYSPSVALLMLTQNPAKGTNRLVSCAAFGVVFAEEAAAVAQIFDTYPVDTTGLTPARVAELCADQDVCHFSCHGVFNPADPLSSGLLLADPPGTNLVAETLTARQIMQLRLDAELVCLSACDSGVSGVTGGDDLLGLLRAFLYAGTPSIVASLWAVDAETTREFMVSFYAALRAQIHGQVDKAEALRLAQLDMIRRFGPRSSFRWAPFTLTGDWH